MIKPKHTEYSNGTKYNNWNIKTDRTTGLIDITINSPESLNKGEIADGITLTKKEAKQLILALLLACDDVSIGRNRAIEKMLLIARTDRWATSEGLHYKSYETEEQ